MNLQEYLEKEMVMRLILRMDITRTRSGTDVEAELLNYWSDEEGACVIHLQYLRNGQPPPTVRISVVTQAFLMERRNREIKHHLQSVATSWQDRGWGVHSDKVVRLRHAHETEPRWDSVSPHNVLVTQDLARMQAVVELTMLNSQEVTSVQLGPGEHLLESELRHTLRDAGQILGHIIRDANRQLTSITQF